MKRILVAIALLLFAPPAFAQCISVDAAREQVATIPGAVLTELEGESFKKAAEIYATFGPEEIDTFVTVDLPDGSGALAVGKPKGFICGVVKVPEQYWGAMRRSILGIGA